MQSGKRKQKQPSSNCYNQELRDIIAWRINTERQRMFPNRGGLGKCARAFGTSDQQWSQYENGRRTPDDPRLEEIAAFFSVSLEHLKTPPEDWETLRNQWLSRIKPGRNSAARAHLSSPAIQDEQPAPESPAPSSSSSDSSQTTIPAVQLIQKIIEVENMHEQGELPTSIYKQTMETIDSLIAMVAKRNSRTTK